MTAANMNTATTLSWPRVLAGQLAFLGRGRRREAFLFLFCSFGFLFLAFLPIKMLAILGVGDDDVEVRWVDPGELGILLEPRLICHIFIYELLFIIGLLWPLSVWRGEGPRHRDAHWSMPVERSSHDLARVAAGALLLLAASATMLATASLGLVMGGDGAALGGLSPMGWTHFFTGPLTFYLLASIAALRSEHPGRVILLGFVTLFVPFAFFAAIEFEPGYRVFHEVIAGRFSYSTALSGPIADILEEAPKNHGSVLAATLIWLGLGVGGVVAAARRAHDT